jgi:hypothetical protein
MKPKLILCLALVLSGGLFVVGCSSLTESQVHCTSLSHENQGLVRSDLNLLLVNHGFMATEHLSEYPSAIGWWFAPLRKGNAEFTVSAYTNSYGMIIYVDNFGLGRGSANKPLTDVIVACIQSNAPDARVYVTVKTDYFPLWPKE